MAHTQTPTQSSSHMPEWLQIWYSISNRQQYRSPNLQEEKNKMENAKKKKTLTDEVCPVPNGNCWKRT